MANGSSVSSLIECKMTSGCASRNSTTRPGRSWPLSRPCPTATRHASKAVTTATTMLVARTPTRPSGLPSSVPGSCAAIAYSPVATGRPQTLVNRCGSANAHRAYR